VLKLKTNYKPIQRTAAFCLAFSLTLISTSLIAQAGNPPDGPPAGSSDGQAQLAAEMGGLGPIGSLPLILGLQAQEESEHESE
jgi:hypothetical protein